VSPAFRRTLAVVTLVLAASGLAYVGMRDLMRAADPFAAYNHPLQPWALAAHVLAAPLAVLLLGWLWGTHVLPKLRRGARCRRGSGYANIALAVTMIASGYLLEVVADDRLRLLCAWVHGVSGTLFAGLLFIHARRAPSARASRS